MGFIENRGGPAGFYRVSQLSRGFSLPFAGLEMLAFHQQRVAIRYGRLHAEEQDGGRISCFEPNYQWGLELAQLTACDDTGPGTGIARHQAAAATGRIACCR